MTNLVVAHIVSGLAGIASGLIIVAEITVGRRVTRWLNAVFILTTLGACGTGFVFLPTDGVTSAQLVSFFITLLLLIGAYAFYFGRLVGSWNPIYGLTVVGALFLNTLITTTQSFLHIAALKAIAPTEQSPIYVAVKITLLCVFVVIAMVVARISGRSTRG